MVRRKPRESRLHRSPVARPDVPYAGLRRAPTAYAQGVAPFLDYRAYPR